MVSEAVCREDCSASQSKDLPRPTISLDTTLGASCSDHVVLRVTSRRAQTSGGEDSASDWRRCQNRDGQAGDCDNAGLLVEGLTVSRLSVNGAV